LWGVASVGLGSVWTGAGARVLCQWVGGARLGSSDAERVYQDTRGEACCGPLLERLWEF